MIKITEVTDTIGVIMFDFGASVSCVTTNYGALILKSSVVGDNGIRLTTHISKETLQLEVTKTMPGNEPPEVIFRYPEDIKAPATCTLTDLQVGDVVMMAGSTMVWGNLVVIEVTDEGSVMMVRPYLTRPTETDILNLPGKPGRYRHHYGCEPMFFHRDSTCRFVLIDRTPFGSQKG